MGFDKELLRQAYYKFAADGRITAHEVKKTIEHVGGGNIGDYHAEQLLRSLAGWDGVVTEHEFVHGIHSYVQQHGHHWGYVW
jgi:Ca2+-binding EF-hand superfamily protein